MIPQSRKGGTGFYPAGGVYQAGVATASVTGGATQGTSTVLEGATSGLSGLTQANKFISELSSLMFGLMLIGTWLTVTAALDRPPSGIGWYNYALLVGGLNIVLGGMYIILKVLRPDILAYPICSIAIATWHAWFILVWNAVGAFLITFVDPYTSLSDANGYFSSWAGFFMGVYIASESTSGIKFSYIPGATPTLLVQFLAQLVILLGSINPVIDEEKNALFGIIASGVLCGLSIILMFWRPKMYFVGLLLFLGFVGTNIAMAGLLTFDGWVTSAGNVYFAVYIAAIFSIIGMGSFMTGGESESMTVGYASSESKSGDMA